MSNVALRKTLYRLEQIPGAAPTFVLNSAPVYDFLAADVKNVQPVNVSGGADLGGFGFLYSKVTMKQAGLMQEFYSLQTVLQWQTDLNS